MLLSRPYRERMVALTVDKAHCVAKELFIWDHRQTWKAGRDGKRQKPFCCLAKLVHMLKEDIHLYANMDKCCRRQKLYKNFLFYDNECNLIECKCCDVCACVCTCDE